MTSERRVLFWMCVLVAVNQLGFGAMIPSLPLYAQSFGVPASAIGLAVGIYGLARFFTALPAGYLADRLGRRPTLALGGLISSLGNLWCAVATSYPEFIVARFIAGAGAGLIVTTGMVVLADITTPAIRARTIAIYQGVFIFAVGIGPYPGGLLAEHYGLRAPFFAYGIAAFGAALVAWIAVKETRGMGEGAVVTGKGPKLAEQLRLLKDRLGFLLVSLIALTNAIVRTGGLFSIIPLFAHMRLGLSVSQIGFAMMLGTVAGLIAGYPAGWLADKFGRKAVIVPATVISGLSMLLFCFAPNYLWFAVASIVWGVAISVGGAAPAAYAVDAAPAGMNAAAISTFRMMSDAGYVIGPLLLGFVADIWTPESSLVLSAALMVAIGAVFGLLAPETHRARHAI